MRAAVGDVLLALVLVGVASMDTPDVWRCVARACQATARVVGQAGIYAEDRAHVLTLDTA